MEQYFLVRWTTQSQVIRFQVSHKNTRSNGWLFYLTVVGVSCWHSLSIFLNRYKRLILSSSHLFSEFLSSGWVCLSANVPLIVADWWLIWSANTSWTALCSSCVQVCHRGGVCVRSLSSLDSGGNTPLDFVVVVTDSIGTSESWICKSYQPLTGTGQCCWKITAWHLPSSPI